MSVASIGPGVESVNVELYAVDPASAKWDRAHWDGETWGAFAWQEIDCEVGEASARWGASQEAGVLSIAEAGELDVGTIDPDRILDPINADSPYFGAVVPGTPIRLVGTVAAAGSIVNPGFEDLPALTGWATSTSARVSRYAAAAHAGGFGLRITGDGVTGSPNVTQDLDVQAGRTINARAWARIVALGGELSPTARLRIQSIDDGGTVIALLGDADTKATSWTQLTVRFTVPAGVRRARITLYAPGTPLTGDELHVDDVTWTAEPVPAATGLIDEASHDVAAERGRIRAIDGIAYLAQSQVPDGTSLPNTLRARVRAIVAAVGLSAIITVEPEAPVDPAVDPPVAAHDGKAAAAWQLIANAATDALVYVWLTPAGVIRFRSFGSFPDASVAFGCAPLEPTGARWIVGLSTIVDHMSAAPIRNRVRAESSDGVWAAAISDGPSIERYGPRPLDVDRVVPNLATWAGRVLADRADAGLEVDVGEVRPYSEPELAALLGLSLEGPSIVRIRDDEHGPEIDLSVGVLGGFVGVTAAGWRFRYTTFIPRALWEETEPEPPVIPPIPPGGTWHTETRIYVATSDALLALTSGGAEYGAGASSTLPVGSWAGWTYRACIDFPAIPWTKVRRIVTARIRLKTTDAVRVGFGSSPTVKFRRITGSWSAGSSSSPSSGNAVVYPGPSTTSSGEVVSNVQTAENVLDSSVISSIVRPWAPSSIGGSAAAQRGVMILPGSGSGSDTTEFWPVEAGGTSRPQLELDLEVFD